MKPKVLACELPELAADTTRQRIQLFPPPGEFVHPTGGEFTLTNDLLAEYVDDVNVRGASIALDYDHSPEKGQGTRASGWFVPGTASVEADGVFTEVEWTPKAAEAIREREYRFISPTFAFAHKTMDGTVVREPKLVGAALTNRPFFNVMEPLAADDLALADALAVEEVFGADVADTLTTIAADAAAALIAAAQTKAMSGRMPMADPGYRKDGKARYPLSTAEECAAAWKAISRSQVAATYDKTQLSRIKARIKRAATKLGVTIGADETTKEKTMELTEAFAADLGVAVDADDETVMAAMQAKLAEAKPKPGTVTLTADEVTKLQEGAEAGKTALKEATEMKVAAELDARVGDFSIAASERDFWLPKLTEDFDGVSKFLREKPKLVSASGGHGTDLKVGETTVTANTEDVLINGVETPVGVDRAKVAAATDQIIRNAGKDPKTVTADEYAAAAMQAANDPNLALSL